MTHGITSWAAYVPYWRLERAAIGAALGTAGGAGSRAVASYDEDATSMAVEAGRRATATEVVNEIDCVTMTTSTPPYLDKTNATAVHAALGLARNARAFDLGGAARSAVAALLHGQAVARTGGRPLVVLADTRTGLPGSTDEGDGGDGAAAFAFGRVPVATVIGTGHASDEFLDRWRLPENRTSNQWEERFAESPYVELGKEVAAYAVKDAGLTLQDVDHLIVVGGHLRAVRRLTKELDVKPEAKGRDLVAEIGNAASAHIGIALADVLDETTPQRTVLVVSITDGADALLLRTTSALTTAQAARFSSGVPTVRAQIEGGRDGIPYTTFLTWKDMLRREPPRRPEPESPAGPPSLRNEAWKFGFTASRCLKCGQRHLPPSRVCVHCGSVDNMHAERLAGVCGTVATFTVDRLAFTPSPPVVAAVIDFDGGGRFTCELTDLDPAEVHIGMRVEMTFRRLYTSNGIHNYFWKAKPLRKGH